jgi:DnaJ-class molecular chaperone
LIFHEASQKSQATNLKHKPVRVLLLSACGKEGWSMIKRDYYIILGVSRSESPAGIHDAFRRLAKKYHPDVSGPDATETFREIAQAYDTLSDPEQRRSYDQTLRHQEGVLRPEPLEQAGHQERYRPEPLVPKPMSILRDFQTIRPSFDALFGRVLRNFTGIEVPKGERIEDLNIEVILSPLEAAQGVIAPIGVPVFRPCSLCGGSGRDWLLLCMACGGQGMIEQEMTVPVHIPPMVRDRTVIEVPIEGLGVHNFFLRLHIRISG